MADGGLESVCSPHPLYLLLSERPAKERARMRWLLMYTLVRNPKLILMRKQAAQSNKYTEFAFAWAVSQAP